MPSTPSHEPTSTILIVGASRGLGHALAAEFLEKGWHVVGTVRDNESQTPLHDLLDEYGDRVEVERLDITELDQITSLHDRLAGRQFDMLFVNAGTANINQAETIADVSMEEFVRVMITNALSPMRVIENCRILFLRTA